MAPMAPQPPLGAAHAAAAVRLTIRAAAGVAAALALGGAAAALLLLPVAFLLPVVYAAAEAAFVVIYFYRYLLLSVQPVKAKPRLGYDPQQQFAKVLQHVAQFGDVGEFLSIWFHGAPLSAIRRGNVADLVAYAFFFQTQDDVAAEGRSSELEDMVAALESLGGLKLQPGCNTELRWMCHLWEPMRHWYRPLAFYAFTELAALLCSIGLQAAGFQRCTWMNVTYYKTNMPPKQPPSEQQRLTPNGSATADATPLVLLHGIGMGLLPYIGLLFNLAATGRPVLAPEFPHVGMRWVLWVPTVDDLAVVMESVMRREGLPPACLLGHSYGTAVASRLLQQHPARIRQLGLIDPVCFTMFMPNLLRNFLYESPATGSVAGDFMMMAAARDLHVAAALSRNFFWTDINLWQEDLPRRSLVVLSGQDALMAAQQVRAWLELQTDAVVMFHPAMAHAGCLINLTWQQQILQRLLQLLDDTGASNGSISAGSRRLKQQPKTGGSRQAAAAGQDAATDDVQAGDHSSAASSSSSSRPGSSNEPLAADSAGAAAAAGCEQGINAAPTSADAAVGVAGDNGSRLRSHRSLSAGRQRASDSSICSSPVDLPGSDECGLRGFSASSSHDRSGLSDDGQDTHPGAGPAATTTDGDPCGWLAAPQPFRWHRQLLQQQQQEEEVHEQCMVLPPPCGSSSSSSGWGTAAAAAAGTAGNAGAILPVRLAGGCWRRGHPGAASPLRLLL